ncbi:MAG: SBBP repeat-containing protein, partial [Chloroflexi bacterium]|nr:SBBP repeat-containing protein [Chloroflexota bacterium]
DLIYSTYLGGDTVDYGHSIVVGQGETVYVAGYTNSSDFPTTAGAYDTTFGGGTCGSYPCYDAFVAKIKAVPRYEITGTVTDVGGNALLGIQVSAGGGDLGTTGTSGEYTISDLPDGVYTVEPITPGYLWFPESRSVTVPPGASGQDFVEAHIQKGSTPAPGTILDFGDVLTYTVMLLYPEDTTQVLYDQVPTYTTYLSGSLMAPASLVYDAAINAISGTLSLTADISTSVSFAVRVDVEDTADFAPPIVNRACVYPVGGDMSDCTWSNEVHHATGLQSIYLPLVMR